MYTPHKTPSRWVEVRSLICIPSDIRRALAAGLRGVEKGYVLGPQAEWTTYGPTPEERRGWGTEELPSSLIVRLRMEASELVAEASIMF